MSFDHGRIVRLKSGDEVSLAIVTTTMWSLKHLYKQQLRTVLMALVQACRDPQYVLPSDASELLEQQPSLVETVDSQGHARIHDAVRAVVLSAFEGEGDAIRMRESPFA